MPRTGLLLACLTIGACTRTEGPPGFAPVRETRDGGAKPAGGGPGAAAPADAGDAPAPTNKGLACAELPRPPQAFTLVDPFPRLPAFNDPTAVVQAPGQPQFWYVAEQAGVLKRFANQPDVSGSKPEEG